MRELTFEVKEFIEQNIDLIEENRWDEVYDNATFNLDSESTGAFTKAMLDIGLDPIREQGLDYIPDYYLSDSTLTTYDIPSNVHHLGEGCFSYSGLSSITIPESVSTLGNYVFYECELLEEVIVLGNIVDMGSRVFWGCSDSLVIRCKQDSAIDTYAREMNLTVEYI